MLDRGSQPWEGLSKKPLRISGKEIGNQPTQQHLWTYRIYAFSNSLLLRTVALSIGFKAESVIFSFRVAHLMQSVMLH